MLVVIDSPYYLFSHFLRSQHHGIMKVATQESRIYKAWPYVGKADIQTTTPGLLFKGL